MFRKNCNGFRQHVTKCGDDQTRLVLNSMTIMGERVHAWMDTFDQSLNNDMEIWRTAGFCAQTNLSFYKMVRTQIRDVEIETA